MESDQNDPFSIVKKYLAYNIREVEQSLSQVQSLLQQRGRNEGLSTDILDRIQNIVADLDELDDTIKVLRFSNLDCPS
jgi:hypothetical protein